MQFLPLFGQLIQPMNVAHHGNNQHHREPASTEHGQPQVANKVHCLTADELLDIQVQRMHPLIGHQVVDDVDISNENLAQQCDVVHLILHLVAQGVLPLYALQDTKL